MIRRNPVDDSSSIHMELEEELLRLKQENKRLIGELNNYRKMIRVMTNSRSWRYTSILRRMGGYAKKILKRTLLKKETHPQKTKMSLEISKAYKLVIQHKKKMIGMGFEEKSLQVLDDLSQRSANLHISAAASWELALWYADKRNVTSARIAFNYLENFFKSKKSSLTVQEVILKAELLDSLGEYDNAKQIVLESLAKNSSQPDLKIAAANLEQRIEDKLKWINSLMNLYNLEQISLEENCSNYFDGFLSNSNGISSPIKVSVIMPLYNAAREVETALKSVLKQTWENIELIVVDDCSTDNSMEILKKYAEQDSRIIILKTPTNSGAYVARNIGLQAATGVFVTCHDSDDWSHPRKIEKQVSHLINNSGIIANTSEQCRMNDKAIFHRRNQGCEYLAINLSSLMFRREEVVRDIGYWDSVRFGGDGEMVRRIKHVFGACSVEKLKTGPLSFTRYRDNSLTTNDAFGFYGIYFGARKEYVEAFNYSHRNNNLNYDFPQIKRPFAIPNPMKPSRDTDRHFDVIIVSDFRLPGGTTFSNVEEIKAQRQYGFRTGLIQMSRYSMNADQPINEAVRELIDGDQVQMLVYGEKVSCELLIVRHPPVLQEKQKYFPEVKANKVNVIINQTPKVDYGGNGAIAYDILRCQDRLIQYFGQKGTWYPIGPSIRETLIKYHRDELNFIDLSDDDWVNIINIDEWSRKAYTRKSDKIRIGRHSRDKYVKWPADPKTLLEIYPNSDAYEVCVLGGAKEPEKTLGALPDNWRVWEFGERTPKEFLRELDVFVYFVHPDCVEAFGRVIFEAMAVGIPVIIPYSYENLFGKSAIYAEPSEVKSRIEDLMRDPLYYQSQVELAQQYVNNQFGYKRHITRCSVSKLVESYI